MPTRTTRSRSRTPARKSTRRGTAARGRAPARKTSRTRATGAKRSTRSTARRTTTARRTSTTRSTSTRRPASSSELASRTVAEVMSPNPVTMLGTESLFSAAQTMRERDIGDVIVLDDTNARVRGIVTDRDMVVRALAEERDPRETTIGAICSQNLTTIEPGESVDNAVKLMRKKAIRRLPVMEDGKPVGIVSIGDLAEKFDQRSALADISSAPANE